MLSYVIVGSGYRAEYFGRVAATYPDLFRALFLCRSDEKCALMKAHTGIDATQSVEDCLAFHPDFIVIAVDRGHIAEQAMTWVERGFAVVTETPVGDTLPSLDTLWRMGQSGAKIVCCEQYHRQPILAAGLEAIRQGLIGKPASAYISMLHDYHAASVLRMALQIQPGTPCTLHGMRHESDVIETDSRYGAILDGWTAQKARDMVHISYATGQEVIYDFCPVQYRSYLRTRHFTVRGERGEWSDTLLLYQDKNNLPQRQYLLPQISEEYRCLDTQALRDRRRNWTAELAPDTVQDEFAIASLLLDMGDYLSGGPSPYPLREALEDAYFWLLLQEAVTHPWQEIASEVMPWH